MKNLLSFILLAYAAGSESDANGGNIPADAVRVGDALNLGQELHPHLQKAVPGTFEPPLSQDNVAHLSSAATLPAGTDADDRAAGQDEQQTEVLEEQAEDLENGNAGEQLPPVKSETQKEDGKEITANTAKGDQQSKDNKSAIGPKVEGDAKKK